MSEQIKFGNFKMSGIIKRSNYIEGIAAGWLWAAGVATANREHGSDVRKIKGYVLRIAKNGDYFREALPLQAAQ